ncbi:MAG: hypothetical protein UR26_C0005G0046 [candidate division TM6 bacterium GW2011_GWF2_32_72]|nr:MAG: hypothetical protein UR26_C0005G0046 [candidate division TM6 bacterium GW2011_GWF2_32_72]
METLKKGVYQDTKLNNQCEKILTKNITEKDILEYQDIFLSNGQRRIQVKSFEMGRSFIYTFLNALNCYQNIACFSSSIKLNRGLNLYDFLMTHSSEFNWLNDELMEEFLLDYFNFDFIWIEEDIKLLNNVIYQKFMAKMEELNLIGSLPVIILSLKK